MKNCVFAGALAIVSCLGSNLFSSSEMDGQDIYEVMKKDIPSVANAGAMAIANLNLDYQGNKIIARPGEKIFSTVNFSCDTDCVNPNGLNQIIIGYEKLGPQKCIFNELGYRCGEGILSFWLEAPKTPGIYDVQCCLKQAPSPIEAMQNWSNEDTIKVTIGRVIVVN